MGKVAVVAFLAAIAVPADAHAGRGKGPLARSQWSGGCGVKDWDIKTAADPDAQNIDPTPRPTTIAALISKARPQRFAGGRIRGVETTTWKLTNVHLLEMKVEPDQDFHLVLGEGSLNLIAEIPSPECLPATSALQDAVASARRVTETAYWGEGGFSNVITVAGLGFFDHEHGQRGAAWNGVELHPVTAICFGQDCKLDAPDETVALGGSVEPAPGSPAQTNARQRKEAIQRDAQAICGSAAAARQVVQAYRDFLTACRTWGSLAGRDCSQNANVKIAADVQAAVVDANTRENEFMRVWGAEAFIGINCQ